MLKGWEVVKGHVKIGGVRDLGNDSSSSDSQI